MKRVLSHPLIALALGIWLRLFFVLRYPVGTAGDTALYEDIATNWLKRHVYAMTVDAAITPTDVRMPGYPAFLSLVYWLTGHVGIAARASVMLAQVAIDVAACFFIAWLAGWMLLLGDNSSRQGPVLKAAFWIALLCPFTANYSAVLLTECLGVFFAAIAFVPFLGWTHASWEAIFPSQKRPWEWKSSPVFWAMLSGFCVGVMTLFRPESPLVLLAGWVGTGWLQIRHGKMAIWLKQVALSVAMFAAVLSPWAIRNAVTLHEFEFLAPKDANLPSEHPPYGFMAWEKTWLYRMSDCYAVTWKLNEEPINLDDIPRRAFDSESEKSQVAALIEQHNQSLNLTQEQDAAFGQIAKERTARHPLRTRLWIPFGRALTIWFTPRIELLPFVGNVFPLNQNWEDDRSDQLVTSGFFLLNVSYLVLAFVAFWRLWKWNARARPALIGIGAYLFVRTAFLTTVEAPEPRYVLVCYPVILALVATLFGKPFRSQPANGAVSIQVPDVSSPGRSAGTSL
jgi:hypothetical protein